MLGAAGHGNAPGEARPGDAEVLEPALDEALHLVAAALGTDELRVRRIMVEQRLLVFRQTEEPALLDGPLDGRAVGRELLATLSSDELALIVIRLVADRIPTLVTVEIEVSPLLHRLPDRLAGAVMIGIGSADKAIVRYVKNIAHVLEKL